MGSIAYYFKKIRDSNSKKFVIFLLGIIVFFVVYRSQEIWIAKNCTLADLSPSCVYKSERLYVLPVFSFILFYILLWLDRVIFYFKKIATNLDSLSTKRSYILNASITCLFAVFIFYIRFSFVPLNPFNINWIIGLGSDLSVHYMGWFVFQQAPWEFPLGIIKNFNFPIGTSVGYTDSIPLLAVIFKIFTHNSTQEIQYSGLWLFSCYVLQAYFSSLIVKNWNCKFIYKIISSVLICMTPVFLNRYGHLAIDAHWVILASFYLYFENNIKVKNKLIWHSLILLFTAWVHPYLTLIMLVLHFSILGKLYLIDSYKIKAIVYNLIFICTFILISWYLIGYFYISSSTGSSIGFYSANLNSFFNPFKNNSQFINELSYWGGQYEGFAYLGLGLIILLFVNTFENSDDKSNIFNKKNISLLIGILLLTLYAISNDVRLASVTILKLPLPDALMNLLGIFQSSGRFIWPFYYLLIIFMLYKLVNRNRNLNKKLIFVLVVLIIQFIDIYPMYKSLNLQNGQNYNNKLDIEKWKSLMSTGKDKILFYPPYQTHLYVFNDALDFWHFAAKNNYSLNIGYYARYNFKLQDEYKEQLKYQIEKGELNKTAIYVSKPADAGVFKYVIQNKIVTCEDVNKLVVCRKN